MAGKATIGASNSGALQERYGDWILTIVNQGTADLARLSYAISYTLYDLQTNTPVLSIELTPGGRSLRGMLALPQGLYLRSVGLPPGGKAAPGLASPFATAFPRGCLVELNLNKAMLAGLRRRRNLTVTLAAADTDREVSYVISLHGFAEALNRALSIVDPYAARADPGPGMTLQ
ncbi:MULTISPECIES: invasion associated locus B family protein [Rhizobium]|uniref:Invasion associated locus B (IalB) family protein n=1 Tax=Rhizobium tropici TaxID=398 RepID=A0A6P1C1D9_RHITR|nr:MULTISPECIES: invasion associated locus B family protein [Rhizobium]AGB74438.1 invasion associated locus B (IalB) family protein [Rhizobium tropici CIAT 899]MBB4242826.1 invasion protein IalB [Rhizobium tropici]MBB5594269.1 invasion protein IalB [Rhizobium tropici]MBB6493151.1 invasion protein IalB [Rhizobium tropici]NEV10808.1 invasion associated locus B (IalB) family protein [Rhizobium tropici]